MFVVSYQWLSTIISFATYTDDCPSVSLTLIETVQTPHIVASTWAYHGQHNELVRRVRYAYDKNLRELSFGTSGSAVLDDAIFD